MSRLYVNKYPLQPKWPLSVGPEGPYESIRDARESIQQNFSFLLQTIPGEWPMDPELGVGLATYLFEGYNSSELDDLKARLKKQLSRYLPAVKLVEAKFMHTDEDQDNLQTLLQITYAIDILGVVDSIDFGLDNINKSLVRIAPKQSQTKIGRVF